MDDDFIELDDDSEVVRHPELVNPEDEFDYDFNSFESSEPRKPQIAEKKNIPNRTLVPAPSEPVVEETSFNNPDGSDTNNFMGDNTFIAPEDQPPQEHVVTVDGPLPKSKYRKKIPVGLIVVILVLLGVAVLGIFILMNNNKEDKPDKTTTSGDSTRISVTEDTSDTTDETESTEPTKVTEPTTEEVQYHEVISYKSNYQVDQKFYCGLIKRNGLNTYECLPTKSDDFLSVDFTYTCKNAGCEYFGMSEDGTNVVLYDGDYFSYNYNLSKRTDLKLPSIMYKNIIPYTHNSDVYGVRLEPYNYNGVGYFDVATQILVAKFGDYPDVGSTGLMAKYGFFYAYDKVGTKLGLYSVSQKKLALEGEVEDLSGKDSLYFVYGREGQPVSVSVDGYITNGYSVFDSNMNLLQFRVGAKNYNKIGQVYSYSFVDFSNDENNKLLDDSLVLAEDKHYYVFYKTYESTSSGDFSSPDYDKILGFNNHYVVIYDKGAIKIRKIGLNNSFVTGFTKELDIQSDYHVTLDNSSDKNTPNLFLYKIGSCGTMSDANLIATYFNYDGKANMASTDEGALANARSNCRKYFGNTDVKGTYYDWNGTTYTEKKDYTIKAEKLKR